MPLPNWLLCALSFAAFSVIKSDNALADGQQPATLPDQDQAQAEVLERAARCDPAALGELYDLYAARIYSYIYHRVGQAELAEDLTGQVFMRMIEAIQGGHAWRTSFSGWLYRIAHNIVIDHYRRRRTVLVELEDAVPVLAADGDPVAASELTLDRQRLRAALAALTEDQAQVITLRFLEDLSIAEVANVMDKTEGAIKALQYRAVLALRRVMGP